MTTEWSTKIVNFMTSGAGVLVLRHGHISHLLKMLNFIKKITFFCLAYIRQTGYIVMMRLEGSTKIVNFVLVQWRSQ